MSDIERWTCVGQCLAASEGDCLGHQPVSDVRLSNYAPIDVAHELRSRRAALRGTVDTLRHVLESAEHPSLTVRSTSYIAKVARDYLDSLGGQ